MGSENIISEISRMKSLFEHKRGVVISEQFQRPTEQNYPINCTGIKVGLPTTAEMQQNFATKSKLNPNKPENKIFFCDTASMNEKLSQIQKKRIDNIANIYSKVDSQGNIKFPGNYHDNIPWNQYVSMYSVTQDELNMAKEKATTLPKATPETLTKTTPTTLQFVKEKFPLRFMMQGENVKKLQKALGVTNSKGQPNITGKFYNTTQSALDAKAKELGLNYNRNVGLDQESFNKIIQSSTPKEIQKVQSSSSSVADGKSPTVNTQKTITLPSQAPQAQTPTTNLSLNQQFEISKRNLETAKQELDAAQKTKDRAAIGAARGKQQKAREEVQRLRNEINSQSQG